MSASPDGGEWDPTCPIVAPEVRLKPFAYDLRYGQSPPAGLPLQGSRELVGQADGGALHTCILAERCIANAATHVQEALARYECEMLAFPRSKRSRRVPTSRAVHGPHEGRSVRIVIDTLVSQPMSIGNIHQGRLTPDPPEVRLSERRDVDPMP